MSVCLSGDELLLYKGGVRIETSSCLHCLAHSFSREQKEREERKVKITIMRVREKKRENNGQGNKLIERHMHTSRLLSLVKSVVRGWVVAWW